MLGFMKKASKKPGLAPGTLVHVGAKKVEKVRIRMIDYDGANLEERELETVDECVPYKDKPTVTWINIDGLHEVDVIEKIGINFGLHPLVLEDIVHTEQRPKMEDFENYIFIITKMLSYDEEENQIRLLGQLDQYPSNRLNLVDATKVAGIPNYELISKSPFLPQRIFIYPNRVHNRTVGPIRDYPQRFRINLFPDQE